MNWKPYWIRCVGVVLAALGLATVAIGVTAGDAGAQPRRRGAQSEHRAEPSQSSRGRAQARQAPDSEAEAEAGAPARGSTAVTGVVNINTATEDELMRLPGIGPAKARAIVQARERNRFRRPEDILRVRGIGRATFRRLSPMLRVDGPTTLQ